EYVTKSFTQGMLLLQLHLFTVLWVGVLPFKILVYNSRYGHSHSNFMGNIADILVDAGHNVTSLIPIIDQRGNDVTVKSKRIIVPMSDETEAFVREKSASRQDSLFSSLLNPITVFLHRTTFARHFVSQCKTLLDESLLIDRLREEQFDVMIVENFEMCGVALSHLLNPRSLITASASAPFSYMFEEFGLPLALSFNPSAFISTMDVHSMWSRLKNAYAEWLMHAYFYKRRSLVEELCREKFGSDFPSLMEISSHAAYTLMNTEPLIDIAAPTLSRVINIGGISVKDAKPLNQEWDTALSRRPYNILISFGSVAKAVKLPVKIKTSIATVISRFPNVTFIWKYEDLQDSFANEVTSSLPNLVLSSWLPQNDLLNDNRISAFVTHGGMGSTQETALRGKPGIFVPLFLDQPRNAGMMAHNGLGMVLDKLDLFEPDRVEEAIREVLYNKTYAENARNMGMKLAKKPFGAKEQLIRTVEFAAEFGPSRSLRPQSYDMKFTEYHNIDILIFSSLGILVLAHTIMKFLKPIIIIKVKKE
ncbi:hypothetical protein PENTCL1PPCAC_17269, partial [Pristionchus entomophagus]